MQRATTRRTTSGRSGREKSRSGRRSLALADGPSSREEQPRGLSNERLLDIVAESYEVESEFEFEGFTCRVLDVPEGETVASVAARRIVGLVVEEIRSEARRLKLKPADLAEASGLSEAEVRLVFNGHPDTVGLAALHRLSYAVRKTLYLEVL